MLVGTTLFSIIPLVSHENVELYHFKYAVRIMTNARTSFSQGEAEKMYKIKAMENWILVSVYRKGNTQQRIWLLFRRMS